MAVKTLGNTAALETVVMWAESGKLGLFLTSVS